MPADLKGLLTLQQTFEPLPASSYLSLTSFCLDAAKWISTQQTELQCTFTNVRDEAKVAPCLLGALQSSSPTPDPVAPSSGCT